MGTQATRLKSGKPQLRAGYAKPSESAGIKPGPHAEVFEGKNKERAWTFLSSLEPP